MPLGGSDRQGITYDDVAPLSFAVWVLRVDGLVVAPFGHHEEGDHSLRSAGLTAPLWETWFEQVVRRIDQPAAPATSHFRSVNRLIDRKKRLAVDVWSGPEKVRSRLAELWRTFRPPAMASHPELSGPDACQFYERLWQSLAPRVGQTGPIHVHFVKYPQVVARVVDPNSVVVGGLEGEIDHETYFSAITAAVDSMNPECA